MRRQPMLWFTLPWSVAWCYAGVVGISVQVCDRRIDPLAASPWEPALLFGSDIVIGIVYGVILAAILVGIAAAAQRLTALSIRVLDRVLLFAPIVVVFVVLGAMNVVEVHPVAGCRP